MLDPESLTTWLEDIQIQQIVVTLTLEAKAATCLTGALEIKYIIHIERYQIFLCD